MTYIMGLDQYDHCYHNLTDNPRKELLRRLSAKTAKKMYIDRHNGDSYHIGWIIKSPGNEDLWITLYNLTKWEQAA